MDFIAQYPNSIFYLYALFGWATGHFMLVILKSEYLFGLLSLLYFLVGVTTVMFFITVWTMFTGGYYAAPLNILSGSILLIIAIGYRIIQIDPEFDE